jgi:CheY-like chemotaxis protein
MAHLLVVEESESKRYFLIRALEHAGHAVAAADSTDGALQLMAHGHYDLLLTHHVLAAGEGAEMARRVQEQDPTIHVLRDLQPTAQVNPTPRELGDLVSQIESALAA